MIDRDPQQKSTPPYQAKRSINCLKSWLKGDVRRPRQLRGLPGGQGVKKDQPSLNLRAVDAHLERGDYGQALELLTPLVDLHPISTPAGSQVRFLMITSWMGQGQNEQALTMARALSRSGDVDKRQQAKQLVNILDAPSLERPDSWTMRLPPLEVTATGGSPPAVSSQRRSRKPKPPPPPPTGPTRAPAVGFAVVVIAVLAGLTLLLSGCVRIDADLELTGPDRMELIWQVQSINDQPMPWQRKFEQNLRRELPQLHIEHPSPGRQRITPGVQSSRDLNLLLQTMVTLAGRSAGVEQLPPPEFNLVERNWLVGIEQHLHLNLDLRHLPDIPGLEVNLRIDHGQIQHTVHSGEQVELDQSRWRWSPLGLGSLLIVVLMGCSLLLQGVRRKLGFGFPELPA